MIFQMVYSRQRNLFWVRFKGKSLHVFQSTRCPWATNTTRSLEIVKPDITSSTIVGTTCAILICLFLIQPLGTAKIGSAFAPIVIIWLLFNFSFGIYVSSLHSHTRFANKLKGSSRISSSSTTQSLKLSRPTSPGRTLCGTKPTDGGLLEVFCSLSQVSKHCSPISVLLQEGEY